MVRAAQDSDSSASGKKKPLKISCTNTDCKNGLHYFGPSGRVKAQSKFPPGKCTDCGADFIDWKRAGSRAPENEGYKLDMFRREWIRHHFWEHYTPSQHEINYTRRKGTQGLAARAEQVLRRNVFGVTGFLNDIQTPYSGAIPAAQHATATCCRKCIEYWHGIPRDAKPTEKQIKYLRDWIMKYLKDKFPNITQEGEKVPPIRGGS
jgi:hypothetical protein